MTSKPKYPLAIFFLAALGGCEPEESMGPPLNETPVEDDLEVVSLASAGVLYTPSSWGIGLDCMRTPDLEGFLADYNWDEMDITNRNKLESLVYWSKQRSSMGRNHLNPWVCVEGEDWEPTPLPIGPNDSRPPGAR